MLIRTRLILIGLLPVLLFLLFIAGMMVTQRQLDSFREKAVFANSIEKNFFNLFVIAHDIKEKNRFERSRQQWPPITQELGQQLSETRGMFSSADESELIETLLEYFEGSQHDFRELEQWLDQHRGQALTTAQQGYLSSLSERLHVGLQSAIPIASRIAAINHENAVAFDQRRENALAAALFFLAGMLLLALWPLIRGITRSVEQLKTGMNRAAFGDLESRIAMTGKDEFAQLARHFNAMIATLAEVTVAREILSAEVIERKRAEEELKLSAQILNSTSDTVFLLDPDGNFVYLNEAAWKSRGYTRDEMMGMNLRELNVPEYNKLLASRIKAVMENGHGFFESAHRCKDGSVMPVEINVRVIESGGRKLLLSVIRDITERKRAELALQESENRFRMMSDSAPVLIWMSGTDKLCNYFNKGWLNFTGRTPEQEMGNGWAEGVHPEDFQRCLDTYVSAFDARQEFSMEYRLRRHDGEYRWVVDYGVPRHDDHGAFLGYIGSCVDITERREHEEELKRSNAELEQFSYAVSHDMRQPLRVISSYLQLLEMGLADQLDGEKRGYFNFAIDGAKRIDQMLVALLEYSRVGKMGEPPTWVESRAVLDEALQFLQPAIAEAQAKLTITGDWPHILASHDEIQRLLQNLIGNAAKFCVIGRIPEIMVASEVVKNEWHLCVTDNGVGIVPDQIKRLFQVFQRLHSREAYEGTGIGLALCRKIAEHHKGRIWAESAGEGKGSKFCVVLPVLREKT